ncbi:MULTISPECIES: type II secretion system protein [Romboutsia]|jgi:type IV pilus assembly protein PilA|uniref:type II secretion system protein n=1 Tax=Romboutsia TaxID=1501226 RepID=UPI002171A669|nr:MULTISPECIES: prepilin-type N-terminal cleavage/methylation domain-containing protein [Romboutsia]MCI9062774.1 prepilin-type N-terminal cleavage/methylation domain-containing protein [Romboutsia sp.]
MKFKSLQKKRRSGFTLVEMVIVVTILGILSGIGFMQFGNVQETSRKNADYVAAANLATAANLCLGENPNIVTTDTGKNKIISIDTLKEKGYINYIPKSQSQNSPFVIKIVEQGEEGKKSEELRVSCDLGGGNEVIFYPKPE